MRGMAASIASCPDADLVPGRSPEHRRQAPFYRTGWWGNAAMWDEWRVPVVGIVAYRHGHFPENLTWIRKTNRFFDYWRSPWVPGWLSRSRLILPSFRSTSAIFSPRLRRCQPQVVALLTQGRRKERHRAARQQPRKKRRKALYPDWFPDSTLSGPCRLPSAHTTTVIHPP